MTEATICRHGRLVDSTGRHFYFETEKTYAEKIARDVPPDAEKRDEILRDLLSRSAAYHGTRVYGGLCNSTAPAISPAEMEER